MALTEKEKQGIENYLNACANFYFVMPLKQIYKIIKLHGMLNVSKEDFYAYATEREKDNEENGYYGIYGAEEWYDEEKSSIENCEVVTDFLHESFGDEEALYYEFVETRSSCSWYVPNYDTLMKYADNFYEEQTPLSQKIFDFIIEHSNCSVVREENIRDGIPLWARMAIKNPIEEILFYLAEEEATLTKSVLKDLIPMLEELYDHTRLPLLRGFTPMELDQIDKKS